MNALMNQTAAQTMSSREIAELTGKEHQHVLRDIRVLLAETHGEVGLSKFGSSYLNSQNKEQPEFLLPKRETLILVSGYSIALRTKIIDRWQELEAQAAKPRDPLELLNDPSAMRGLLLTYSEKLIALQDEVKELEPKAAALERLSDAEGSLCISDAAKSLQIMPSRLFKYLESHDWIYKRVGCAGWLAYRDKMAAGHMIHKSDVVQMPDGFEKIRQQARVTSKGMARLAKELSSPLAA